jgi:hypothetical protein
MTGKPGHDQTATATANQRADGHTMRLVHIGQSTFGKDKRTFLLVEQLDLGIAHERHDLSSSEAWEASGWANAEM